MKDFCFWSMFTIALLTLADAVYRTNESAHYRTLYQTCLTNSFPFMQVKEFEQVRLDSDRQAAKIGPACAYYGDVYSCDYPPTTVDYFKKK